MPVRLTLLLFPLMLFSGALAHAQDRTLIYPALPDHGGVYDMPEAVVRPSPDRVHRVVFDVIRTGADADKPSRSLGTIARMINLYASAGVPVEKLEISAVLHGAATRDALGHEAYRVLFGVDNPNLALLDVLEEAGVSVYVCGQSLMSQGNTAEDVADGIEVALAALTVLIEAQLDGAAVIAW